MGMITGRGGRGGGGRGQGGVGGRKMERGRLRLKHRKEIPSGAVLDEIDKIQRKGKPLILRMTDFYILVHSIWVENGVR